MTQHFKDSGGDLWRIDRAEDLALVIVVSAEPPLVGVGLDAVLTEAAGRQSAVVCAREVQPTQATKDKR